MSAHTLGPWEAERMRLTPQDKDRRSGFVVNGPDVSDALPVRICDLRVPQGMTGFAEGEANARLIAAAPELLAALENATDAMAREDFGTITLLPKLRAAISRARGQP